MDEAELLSGLLLTANKSFAEFFSRLWRAIDSPLMCPGLSPRSLIGKAHVLLSCLATHRSLWSWHAKAADPAYSCMVERHPLLPALRRRPYLNSSWSVADKMRVIETHYGLLHDVRLLAFPLDASILLAGLDAIEPGLTVVLDKPAWFANEGEVAINLFSDDERIYSLLFTLGKVGAKRVAYVGALQGRSLPDAVERYKRITREAHGMRPRDLLFATFRMLCCELAVERILAVSDQANVARSAYFGKAGEIFVNHDGTWAEYGGAPTDGGFFDIPAALGFRNLEEVPTRKRAQYRRRYTMLEDIRDQMAAKIRGLPSWRYQQPLTQREPAQPRSADL